MRCAPPCCSSVCLSLCVFVKHYNHYYQRSSIATSPSPGCAPCCTSPAPPAAAAPSGAGSGGTSCTAGCGNRMWEQGEPMQGGRRKMHAAGRGAAGPPAPPSRHCTSFPARPAHHSLAWPPLSASAAAETAVLAAGPQRAPLPRWRPPAQATREHVLCSSQAQNRQGMRHGACSPGSLVPAVYLPAPTQLQEPLQAAVLASSLRPRTSLSSAFRLSSATTASRAWHACGGSWVAGHGVGARSSLARKHRRSVHTRPASRGSSPWPCKGVCCPAGGGGSSSSGSGGAGSRIGSWSGSALLA